MLDSDRVPCACLKIRGTQFLVLLSYRVPELQWQDTEQ